MQSNVTGQHDRQDRRLTGQLPNHYGHCPLTGRYFEPWIQIFLESRLAFTSSVKLWGFFFLGQSKSGFVITDRWDHGASKEPTSPCQEWIRRFL